MSADEMKQDPTVTLNWFRINLPTIVMILGLGYYVGTELRDLQKSMASLKEDNVSLKSTTADMNKLTYRVDQLELGRAETNARVDGVQNTLISQIDLVRRDVNRTTTQMEVLSSRVGILIGDVDDPKQRRSRPAP